jgi:hypothetical protein
LGQREQREVERLIRRRLERQRQGMVLIVVVSSTPTISNDVIQNRFSCNTRERECVCECMKMSHNNKIQVDDDGEDES